MAVAAGYRNLLRRYERYAPRYDRRFARYSDATLTRALALVPDCRGDLLDVACGTGLFERMLRQHRPRLQILGVDISEAMLDKARSRFPNDDQVRFERSTAEQLPAADSSFDIVCCNNAFHLVQDGARALAEFNRVLKPHGCLVIIDWCMDYPQVMLMDWFQRVADRQIRTIRTCEAMTNLVQNAGFSVSHCERFRVPLLWGLMAIRARKETNAPAPPPISAIAS